jgi:mannose-6-phosphate isomerase-like protein (cupin superfamily)
MPFIAAATAPRFELHGATFIGLAAPSRGATETAVWMVTLTDTGEAVTHRLSREEVLVCIEGRALATLGTETHELTAGSAIVVPPDTDFRILNPDPAAFRAVAVLPVGGRATVPGRDAFVPPWAA